MTLHRIGWLIWMPGALLVLLGWTGHVAPRTGWLGFILTLVGALLSWIPASSRRTPLVELAKLADLRDRGAITPEEFERTKRELLDRAGRDGGSPGARPY